MSLFIQIKDNKDCEPNEMRSLEAKLVNKSVSGIGGIGTAKFNLVKKTEISCKKGLQLMWSDRISSKVTALVGNKSFWAVGCEDGSMQVSIINTSSFVKFSLYFMLYR
jgi:hypothetical protein